MYNSGYRYKFYFEFISIVSYKLDSLSSQEVPLRVTFYSILHVYAPQTKSSLAYH